MQPAFCLCHLPHPKLVLDNAPVDAIFSTTAVLVATLPGRKYPKHDRLRVSKGIGLPSQVGVTFSTVDRGHHTSIVAAHAQKHYFCSRLLKYQKITAVEIADAAVDSASIGVNETGLNKVKPNSSHSLTWHRLGRKMRQQGPGPSDHPPGAPAAIHHASDCYLPLHSVLGPTAAQTLALKLCTTLHCKDTVLFRCTSCYSE